MKIYARLPYYNIHLTPILDMLNLNKNVKVSVGLLHPGKLFRQGYDWDSLIDSSLGYNKIWQNKQRINVKDFDVIMVHGIFSYWSNYFLVIKALLYKKKIVIFSEGLKPNSKLNRFLKKITLRFIDSKRCILFELSDNTKEDYNLLGIKRWESISFGYCTSSKPFKNFKVNNPIQLLYVGQLVKRKSVDTIIKACKELEVDSFRLNIVGEGTELIKLKELVNTYKLNNNIKFKGLLNQVEVREEMKMSDVLILPSIYEGWGTVVNEAMITSNAVLVSNKVRCKSLLSDEFVFEAQDHVQLRKILEDLKLSSTKLLQVKSQNFEYIKKFTPEELSKKLLKTLN